MDNCWVRPPSLPIDERPRAYSQQQGNISLEEFLSEPPGLKVSPETLGWTEKSLGLQALEGRPHPWQKGNTCLHGRRRDGLEWRRNFDFSTAAA
jgi:hypothetical protein